MKKPSTTFGLSCRTVVDLLQVGSDENQVRRDGNQDKTDVLNDILNATLPACLTGEEDLLDRPAAWKRPVEVLSGDGVGGLLQNPKADVSLMRIIKDHGRKVSSNVASKAEYQAGNTVYFAAIAHAVVFQGVRITKLSYADLHRSFVSLTRQDWIPGWLLELLEQASTECLSRMP